MKKILAQNKILAAILVLSFLLCLGYSFYFQISPSVDAKAYDLIAQNITAGYGYRSSPASNLSMDGSITRVGPLYEYFLGGIYWVFGHHLAPVWVFQALLHILSAWLIYLVCLKVCSAWDFKRTAALWAAGIFAFYPDLIESSAMLLTETFYLFLVCLFLYFFFLFFERRNYWLAGALGISAGLATLARPTILFFVPVVCFYFWQKRDWKRALVFLAMLGLVFVPWTARNYLVFHKIMPLGAAGAFNFWIGNYHGGSGEQEPTEVHTVYMSTHGFQELQDESIRQFKAFVREYPGEFAKLTALRVNKYFSIVRPMGFWFYQAGWGQLVFILSSAAASVLLFVLGFAGLLRAWRSKNETVYYLAAFILMTPLINFITVVETRYRFQVYPLLAILAGFYLSYLIYEKKIFSQKVLWIATGVIFANGAIDLLLSWDKFWGRLSQFL